MKIKKETVLKVWRCHLQLDWRSHYINELINRFPRYLLCSWKKFAGTFLTN